MRLAGVAVLAFALLCAGRIGAQDARSPAGAGIDAANRGDFAEAYRLLKPAADAGDADAQATLGSMYARAEGVKQSEHEAFRLYRLSASQGNVLGMNGLGMAYRDGMGVPVDVLRAVHWFCRAAAQGDSRALNRLGDIYDRGLGVSRDVEEARSLWRQSVERGDPYGMIYLGRSLYMEPPQNKQEGRDVLAKAARLGNPLAQTMMRRLEDGDPLPAVVEAEAPKRPSPQDLRPARTRDCGSFVS